MHGKIAIYMDSTGRGTVTNSAKLFFEFNRQSWSDKRSMPSVGMLVEFRAEGKTITSVRPSRYQHLKREISSLKMTFGGRRVMKR